MYKSDENNQPDEKPIPKIRVEKAIVEKNKTNIPDRILLNDIRRARISEPTEVKLK